MTRGITPKNFFKNRLWRKYLQTHHSHDYAVFTRARNNLRSLTGSFVEILNNLQLLALSRTQRASGNMQMLV